MAAVAQPSAQSKFQVTSEKFKEVNDFDNRLSDIYKQLNKSQYTVAYENISNVLAILKNSDAKELDLEKKVYKSFVNELYRMRVSLKLRKYDTVHNKIRDMHYSIYNVCTDTDEPSIDDLIENDS